jgi:hypothetical protein
MDWTQIVLGVIQIIGSVAAIALPIGLPIILNRSHKKTRDLNSAESTAINSRIDMLGETMTKTVGELAGKLDKNIVTTQGLHLLDVIEHRPHCWETIRQAFESYAAAGGNSHVEKVYRQWEDDYGRYYDEGQIPPVLMKVKRNTKPA